MHEGGWWILPSSTQEAPLFCLFILLALSPSWLPGVASSLERGPKVLQITNRKGLLERTVFLPPPPPATSPADFPFFQNSSSSQEDEEDDNFILISDSSQHKFKELRLPQKKVIKRRRVRKKITGNRTLSSNSSTNVKDPKFLSLLSLVSFENGECGEGGICYHEYECGQLGGRVEGPCAAGFGVCCALEVGCGERSRRAQTLFVGRGATAGACSLTLEKLSCTKQIRLDFYQLQMAGPVEGNCLTDRLLIAGQNTNNVLPIICGENSGQHMHVDVDEVDGPLTVSVVSSSPKKFRLRVSQLCEGHPLLAPKHCLQHYTALQGRITSFNYLQSPDSSNSSYMNNMNYAMCVKKGRGMCSVVYRTPEAPEAPGSQPASSSESMEESPSHRSTFDIKNQDPEGAPTIPEGEAGAEVFNCPEDYLVIRGVRLCGQVLNDPTSQPDFTRSTPVIDNSPGPFIVSFVSSSSNVGRGFQLHYEQQPCNP